MESTGEPGERAGLAAKGKRGPKTKRGKAAVRMNPLKHGVLSQTPVIPLVEKASDWKRLRAGVFAYFDVQGVMEESLGDIIATCVWRRKRVMRMETEAISDYLHEVPRDYWTARLEDGEKPPKPEEFDVRAMDAMLSARLLPDEELMDQILRYETKQHRFMMQTIHQLLVLQALRKGGMREGAPGHAVVTADERNYLGGVTERARSSRPRFSRTAEPAELVAKARGAGGRPGRGGGLGG